MTQGISVYLGPAITYLYGTVNGIETTFTLGTDGIWRATVPRSDDDVYVIHIEAYSADGLEDTLNTTVYYGAPALIIDRTQADVDRAMILAGKGWAAMTAQERAEWNAGLRGAYSAEDLNRVTQTVKTIADLLALRGQVGIIKGVISIPAEVVTDDETGESWIIPAHDGWIDGDEPTPEQLSDYLADVAAIKAATSSDTRIPVNMQRLDFTGANQIERLLYEVYFRTVQYGRGYRKCGTLKSRQGVILPYD